MNLKSSIFLFSAYYPGSLGVIVTTLVGLSSLKDGNVILSSIIFSVSFVFSILIPPTFARYINSFELSVIRLLLFFTRTAAIIFTGITIILNFTDSTMVYFSYTIFMFILSLDQVLISDAPTAAKDYYGTSYSSSNALGNVLNRGIQGVSPIIATAFIVNGIQDWVITSFLLSAFSMYIFPLLYKRSTIILNEQKICDEKHDDIHYGSHNSWAQWYIFFITLVNLSQGAVGFVLLSLDPHSQGPILTSLLYFSYLIIQFFIIFGWLKFNKNNIYPDHVALLLILSGVLFLLFSMTESNVIMYFLVFFIGIAYGLSSPMFSEALLDRLRGPKFRENLAYGKSAGRISSVASLTFAGVALSFGVSHSSIFITCGVLTIVNACVLLCLAKRIRSADLKFKK